MHTGVTINPAAPPGLRVDAVLRMLDSLPRGRLQEYEQYFDGIRPRTDAETFRRGLFALSSVHTTWYLNCVLYEMLWDYQRWLGDDQLLAQLLHDSRAGMHRNRHRYFKEYADRFWAGPDWYSRSAHETWFDYRDRVQSATLGLGPAKAAFFCELTEFQSSDVVCFDTHVLQLYGMPSSISSGPVFRWAEGHWALSCRERGINPVTARWLFWDMKQRKSDSRYWSVVLEGDPRGTFTGRQLLLFDL